MLRFNGTYVGHPRCTFGSMKAMTASKEINDIVYRRDAFLSKTLIRKVAKTFQGNPGITEPSFSINSHISRIQTQFYQALYRGLLIEGLVTRLSLRSDAVPLHWPDKISR